MKAGKVGLAAAQVLLGLVLLAEVVYLACFFRFLVPAMIQVLEETDTVLPGPMILVLNLAMLLHGVGGVILAVVLVVCAIGWGVFELACRSEAKPVIRLAVGGSAAFVLGVLALWVSLVSFTTLRHLGHQASNALVPRAPPALHASAPHDARPGAA